MIARKFVGARCCTLSGDGRLSTFTVIFQRMLTEKQAGMQPNKLGSGAG